MKGQTSRTERSLNHIKMESLTGICDRVHQVAILCIVWAMPKPTDLHRSLFHLFTRDYPEYLDTAVVGL